MYAAMTIIRPLSVAAVAKVAGSGVAEQAARAVAIRASLRLSLEYALV